MTHINQIIDTIIADRTITRVDMVAHHFGTTPRTLQRLFRQYVGVSPKWVIKINDFKALIGTTPATYAQQNAPASCAPDKLARGFYPCGSDRQ